MSPNARRVVDFYQSLSEASLDRIAEVYAPGALFRDPFSEVRGCAQIERIFRQMFARLEAPGFRVTECFEGGERAALRWQFRFRFRGERREHFIDGMSRLAFAADGRVCSHEDFWDAAGGLYAHLPIVGRLMRWLASRIG